jgi:hypothetical protein
MYCLPNQNTEDHNPLEPAKMTVCQPFVSASWDASRESDFAPM